jgi:uncharacterized protein YodC (DUF2158 family)
MTVIKSGDLVVLKSGGPVMTIDTVNTDIFDDSKITGVLCAWFVGTRLERVRFDHSAIEPAPTETVVAPEAAAPQTSVEYKAVLDDMVDAMNLPAEAAKPVSSAAPRKSKRAKAPEQNDVAVAASARVN